MACGAVACNKHQHSNSTPRGIVNRESMCLQLRQARTNVPFVAINAPHGCCCSQDDLCDPHNTSPPLQTVHMHSTSAAGSASLKLTLKDLLAQCQVCCHCWGGQERSCCNQGGQGAGCKHLADIAALSLTAHGLYLDLAPGAAGLGSDLCKDRSTTRGGSACCMGAWYGAYALFIIVIHA